MANFYTEKDYEKHRPEMLRQIATAFTAPDGGFDEEGYNKAVMRNMYDAGDMAGIQKFTQMQKEKSALKKQEEAGEEDRRYKRGQIADQRLQYLGPLAQKTLEIHKTQGPEAANAYYQNVQKVALDMGLMKQEEYEDAFNPDKAQVVADYYGKAYGEKKASTGEFTKSQLFKIAQDDKAIIGARERVQKKLEALRAKGKKGSDDEMLARAIELDRGLESDIKLSKKPLSKEEKKAAASTERKGGPSSTTPPKGAVDTKRTMGGKPVWKLPNGKFWIQSKAGEPVNLAMNAEDVPLGTGMADQAKSSIQLRKELIDAIDSGDSQREKEIRQQIDQSKNSSRHVG